MKLILPVGICWISGIRPDSNWYPAPHCLLPDKFRNFSFKTYIMNVLPVRLKPNFNDLCPLMKTLTCALSLRVLVFLNFAYLIFEVCAKNQRNQMSRFFRGITVGRTDGAGPSIAQHKYRFQNVFTLKYWVLKYSTWVQSTLLLPISVDILLCKSYSFIPQKSLPVAPSSCSGLVTDGKSQWSHECLPWRRISVLLDDHPFIYILPQFQSFMKLFPLVV